MKPHQGALITYLDKGGVAYSAGLRPGDRLLSINGHQVRDLIDVSFYSADPAFHFIATRNGHVLDLQIENDGSGLGIDFEAPTTDGIRRCRNNCPFCFVKHLPRGLRSSLYVKDDDYRYSFLFGGFVTLSNLDEEDWQRLAEQRLSPLYVSVHATETELRRKMLGNPTAPDIMAQLRRLAEMRIRVHAQVVLCPGMNDGIHLERTVSDLSSLADTVESVAIVPVGLTRYGNNDLVRAFTVEEMRRVLRDVRGWQRGFRRTLGRTFVHLADEFYLRTGATLPSESSYDGYPQYENGVGMARVLLSQWSLVRRRLRRSVTRGIASSAGRLTVGTGELIAPLLSPILDSIAESTGMEIDLVPVENRFFGPTVNVAGLLTADDVLRTLATRSLGDMVVLPRTMFDADGLRTLDGATLGEIEACLGVPVYLAESVSQFLSLVAGARREIA